MPAARKLLPAVRRFAAATGEGLAALLYPARCFGCSAKVDSPGLCAACEAELRPVRPPFCDTCGEPVSGEIYGDVRCTNCSGREFGYGFAIAGYLATGPLRQVIHDFKYHRRLAVRATLARLAEAAFDDPRLRGPEAADWVVVPVPLHPRRQRERGYNQAAEVAALLARSLGLGYCEALARTRYTSAQARLVRDERLANLSEAFALDPSPEVRTRIDGAPVVLFDDVFTTGATADACARVLRDHGGAEKVVVATVARG